MHKNTPEYVLKLAKELRKNPIRQKELESQNMTVLRFKNEMIYNTMDQVLHEIEQTIEQLLKSA